MEHCKNCKEELDDDGTYCACCGDLTCCDLWHDTYNDCWFCSECQDNGWAYF